MTPTPQGRRVPAMGQPVARSATPMTHFDITFDNPTAEAIRQIALDRGIGVSAVVRELCQKGLQA